MAWTDEELVDLLENWYSAACDTHFNGNIFKQQLLLW